MTFSDLLARWNKGIRRGAQTRFAKVIGLAQPTVARWASGAISPSEDIRPKVARELGVSVDELMEALRVPSAGRRYRLAAGYAGQARDGGSPAYGTTLVPVVAQAESPRFSFDFDDPAREYLTLTLALPGGRRCAAVRAAGPGLEPLMADGEYALVVEAKSAPGDRWSVARVGAECALLKAGKGGDYVEFKDGGEKKLKLSSGGDVEVAGVVVGFFRKA
ncbi:MAG: helix-turn-helix domain-containing protein [Elusimicrobiota bacterium]